MNHWKTVEQALLEIVGEKPASQKFVKNKLIPKIRQSIETLMKKHSKLYEIRKGLGVTLQEAGEKTGFTKSKLSRIECGKQEPTVSEAAILAPFYGLEVGEFVTIYIGTKENSSEKAPQ